MRIKFIFIFLTAIAFLPSCKSSNKPKQDKKPDTIKPTVVNTAVKENPDSIQLTALLRAMYSWHEADTAGRAGFRPTLNNPTDTLAAGIDLEKTDLAIKRLAQTGFFAKDFLDDYRSVAVRMDNELHTGKTIWIAGDISPFSDADEWCNCQDNPNNYWETLTLTGLRIDKNEASFKWTWGRGFFYKTRAKKIDGKWKISYLEGFDMNYYEWGSKS